MLSTLAATAMMLFSCVPQERVQFAPPTVVSVSSEIDGREAVVLSCELSDSRVESCGFIFNSEGIEQRVLMLCLMNAALGAQELKWDAGSGFLFRGYGNHLRPVLRGFPNYGSRSLLWQDVSSRWARVADRSVRGLAADAGVIVNLGRFSLLAGVSSLDFSSVSAEFGAGLRF